MAQVEVENKNLSLEDAVRVNDALNEARNISEGQGYTDFVLIWPVDKFSVDSWIKSTMVEMQEDAVGIVNGTTSVDSNDMVKVLLEEVNITVGEEGGVYVVPIEKEIDENKAEFGDSHTKDMDDLAETYLNSRGSIVIEYDPIDKFNER